MNFEDEAWHNLEKFQKEGKDFEDLQYENNNPIVENQNVKNYLELKEKIKGYPDLVDWFQNVLEYGARYTSTVAGHEYERRRMSNPNAEFRSRVELERADETRRTAHLALLDTLRIFCRAANKEGLDFSFLYDILRGDEETIRNNVRKFITDVLDYEAVRKGGKNEQTA